MLYQIQNFPSLQDLEGDSLKSCFTVNSFSSPMIWALLVQSKLFQKEKILFIFPSHKDILDFQEALFFLDPQKSLISLKGFKTYPSSQWLPSERELCQRMKWLYEAQKQEANLLCATVCDLSQKTLPFKVFKDHITSWSLKDKIPLNLKSFFNSLGYKETVFCETPGTYALRGGLFDVFSPAYNQPVRGELFGNEIMSLKEVDIATQRSTSPLTSLEIIPSYETLYVHDKVCESFLKDLKKKNLLNEVDKKWIYKIEKKEFFQESPFLLNHFYENLESPLHYIKPPFSMVMLEPLLCKKKLKELEENAENSSCDILSANFDSLYTSYENIANYDLENQISPHTSSVPKKIFISDTNNLGEDYITISSSSSFFLDSKDPLSKIKELKQNEITVFIASPHTVERKKLNFLLEDCGLEPVCVKENEYLWESWMEDQRLNPLRVHILPRSINKPLFLKNLKICFLREKDVIASQHGFKRKRPSQKTKSTIERAQALSFGELSEGDYLVHDSHGIGVYRGLKILLVERRSMEFLSLEYKGGDKLYVPIFDLNRLYRYSGKSSSALMDRLGDKKWNKKRKKAFDQIQSIAGELLKIYALRKKSLRDVYQVESEDLAKFEREFFYEETPEQRKAIDDIFCDMKKSSPMDRLICGEVGSGKTEVALRAVFVACYNQKQVAFMAPTTLLSFQHFQNFQRRFKDWPIEVCLINRFVSRSEIKKILNKTREGKVDVLIGTHRLLSSDVSFKNLGLLVVDEEQKFGVRAKEAIKKMKSSVDMLALSATPIPRTLNLSLMGIRDLTLIKHPPPGRQPVETFLCHHKKEGIKKAVNQELDRDGQVFFMHNRVKTIPRIYEYLKELLPHASIGVVHGQMKEHTLEKTMLKFLNKDIQVLICTSLIESGIDIPQVNTLIVDQPELLGLSQLYQLRGRIGRSDRKAYCYLLFPKNRELSPEALERMKVVQENNSLGSGLQIAQYDLNIRGAGPLLGTQQSGLVETLGYEFFMSLLEEALNQLRGDRKDVFHPDVSLPASAYIPSDYIDNFKLKLIYYKNLSLCDSPEDLKDLELEMKDRFGNLPEPVIKLLELTSIRQECERLRILNLKLSKKSLSLDFDQESSVPLKSIKTMFGTQAKSYKLVSDQKIIIYKDNLNSTKVLSLLNQF